MKFSDERNVKLKSLYALLSSIIFLALAVRYPYLYGSHQGGMDSFYYHTEVNSILTFHEWTQFLHPLSAFGFYAYSDTSGVPFYLAEIVSLTGLNIEQSIIILDYLIVIIGTINAFILGLKIKRNAFFSAFLTVGIIFAPKVIEPTIFSITERGALILLLPFWSLLIIIMLKSEKRALRIKFTVLFLICSILLLTIHRIFIFSLSFLVAYILLRIYIFLKNKKMIPFIVQKYSSYIIVGMFILLINSLFIVDKFITIPGFGLEEYKTTALFEGDSFLIILLNIGVSASGGVGILLPIFAPIGLLYIIYKKNRSLIENFFLTSALVLTPFLINRLYIRPFLIIICAIFIAYGAFYTVNLLVLFCKKIRINVDWKKVCIIILLISLIASIIFSGYLIQRWNNASLKLPSQLPRYMTDDTYNTAIWTRYNVNGVFISNFMSRGIRIQAYSNKPMLPGIYYMVLDNIVLYKLYENRSELKIKFDSFMAKQMFSNEEKWKEFYLDYVRIMGGRYPSVKNILDKYNVTYFIFYNKFGFVREGWYGQRLINSPFCKTALENNYIVYSNTNYNIMILS